MSTAASKTTLGGICALLLSFAPILYLHAQIPTEKNPRVMFRTNESVELHSKESFQTGCQFLLNFNESITLDCGEQSFVFAITGQKGLWSHDSANAVVEYKVTYLDSPGKIVIRRNSNQLTALVDFTESQRNGMKRSFLISSVE